MSVTGVNSGSTDLNTIQSYSTTAANSTSESNSTSATKADESSSKADSITFSRPAEMLSKLQQLKTEDPDEFQKVISSFVTQLQSAAEAENGSIAGNVLDIWAKKFQSIADTGDLSRLTSSSSANINTVARAYYSQQQMSLAELLNSSDESGSGNDLGSLLSGFVNDAIGSIS